MFRLTSSLDRRLGGPLREFALALSFAMVTFVVAIDGRSLWIDEFNTWVLTRPETLADWWVNFAIIGTPIISSHYIISMCTFGAAPLVPRSLLFALLMFHYSSLRYSASFKRLYPGDYS